MAFDGIDGLKQYIKDTLGAEIIRLTNVIKEQEYTLHAIEIKTTTDVTEIKKDIQQLQSIVLNMQTDQRDAEESQKIKWKMLNDERKKEQEEQQKKELEVTKVFSGINTMTKLLWIAITLAATLVGGFIWDRIVHGGL